MPDAGFHKCGITESEVIQTNAAVSTDLSQEFNMNGADKLIIMEELEVTDNPTISEDGTEFNAGNPTDLDLSTSETESGTDTDTGVFDFGSIANRDFGVKYSFSFGGSDNATYTIEISDDDISYTTIHTRVGTTSNDNIEYTELFTNQSFRYVKFNVDPDPAEAHTTNLFEVYATSLGNLVLEIKETDSDEWRPYLTFPQLGGGLFGTTVTRIIEVSPTIVEDGVTKFNRILPSGDALLRFTQVQAQSRKHQIVIHKVNTCRG